MQNRVELFSTAAKLFVWRLRLREQKARSSRCWNWTKCKSVIHYKQWCRRRFFFGHKSFAPPKMSLLLHLCYKYLGILLDTELSDDKDIQRQLRYQYCAANNLRASFSRCSKAVKMCVYVPSIRPWMYHNYGFTSGRHTCIDCMWPIILLAGLYTTCRNEGVLVVIRFNVAFLPLRPCCEKMCTSFFNDEESLTTYGCALWCRQLFIFVLIFFEHYNDILLCDWVLNRYNVLRACACHNAFIVYLVLTRFELSVLLWM